MYSFLFLCSLILLCLPTHHAQSSDDQELLIWSCSNNGVNTYYYDPALIQYYAQTATTIIIRSNLDSDEWIQSTPDSYALDALRLGKSLSYTVTGDYAVTSGWSGPMSSHMWNSCGQTDSFVNQPYWACNNGNGLHLTPNACGWITTGTPGGISIFIKRQLDAPIPIWRCYGSGKNALLVSTAAGLNAIAKKTSAIAIYTTANPSEYVRTSSPNSYAIQSLAAGVTLSYTTTGGYAIVNDWVGSSASMSPAAKLWNSCGSNQGFTNTPYWSCNNGNGLHLTPNVCGWTSAGGTPITVAVTLTEPAPYRLVRIWYCDSAGKNTAVYPTASIQTFAKYATGITIMSRNNPEEYVSTKSSSSYALVSLRAGRSLSFTASGGYAIVDDWVGTMTTCIPNSCGTADDFSKIPYWACNNGNGLHLTQTLCGWTSAGNTPGGLAVYLHFPIGFTGSIQNLIQDDDNFAHPTTVVNSSSSGSSLALILSVVGAVVLVVVLVVSISVVVYKKNKAKDEEGGYQEYLISTL